MKILKNKTGFFSLFAIFMIPLLFTACEQDSIKPIGEISPEENQKIMDALCNHMHDCNDIEVLENAVVVDKCMHIDKANMLEYLTMLENGIEKEPVISKVPHPLDPSKMLEYQENDVQYYGVQNDGKIEERQMILGKNQFAKNSEVTDLTYHITQSARNCNIDNEKYINEAIGYWSSIKNCRVRFSYKSDYQSADIVFGCDSDPRYRLVSGHGTLSEIAAAMASWPNPNTRKVGKYISINDNYADTKFRKGVMIHEIGHCLGLYHTDVPYSGYYLSNSAIKDPFSIMDSGSSGHETNDFTKEDFKMVRRLWPEKLSKPTNFEAFNVGRLVFLKFKNEKPLIEPYDNIKVIHWYQPFWSNYGTLQKTQYLNNEVERNGDYFVTLDKQYPPGNHYFRIAGRSLLGEVVGDESNWEYVEIK